MLLGFWPNFSHCPWQPWFFFRVFHVNSYIMWLVWFSIYFLFSIYYLFSTRYRILGPNIYLPKIRIFFFKANYKRIEEMEEGDIDFILFYLRVGKIQKHILIFAIVSLKIWIRVASQRKLVEKQSFSFKQILSSYFLRSSFSF